MNLLKRNSMEGSLDVFEGMTAEVDLVAAFKLKIILLRADFYY